MTRKTQETVSLGYLDLECVEKIVVTRGTRDPEANNEEILWIWDATGKTETHNPMDRVGGPMHISGIDTDSEGDRWFLFSVVDSYFPVTHLVRGNSFEDAYEYYVDYAAKHCGIKIEEPDLKDYKIADDDEGTLECDFTSDGQPVDTSNIHGQEARLVSVHFAKNPNWNPRD